MRNPKRVAILMRMNGELHQAEIARELGITDTLMSWHMQCIKELPKSLLEIAKVDGRRIIYRCKIDFSKVFFNLSESIS